MLFWGGKKIFNLHFLKKISYHWRSVISLISPLHPSAGLHSCSLSSNKGKKHNFRAILFFFSPPSSRLHQEVWYKKLVKPTVATLLSVREVRPQGRTVKDRRCCILAAFPYRWQVSCSRNGKSRTFFHLCLSDGPVFCLNSEEFSVFEGFTSALVITNAAFLLPFQSATG